VNQEHERTDFIFMNSPSCWDIRSTSSSCMG